MPDALELPEFPAGWSVVALQDLVTVLQYGTSKRAERDVRNGVAVLRMGNIRDGRLDVRRAKLKWTAPGTEDVGRYLLRPGDILFNRTNSPELVGKAAVFDADAPMIFASYLVRITCDERLVLPEFLCSWINSPWGRSWARAVRSDCVSQSNISIAKLRSMPVPLPPLDEQRASVRRMRETAEATDQIQERAEAALAYAERLPRAILEQAMQGDLVPLEADLARLDGREYEPAVFLLDRLRTGRPVEKEVKPPRKARKQLAGLSPEALLAAIRRASWGSLERSADELIDAVIDRLKIPEPDPGLRSTLHALMETAVERRILARRGSRLVGATPKIGRYDDEFLLGVLGRVMREGVSYNRKQLSRAMVSWLGYDQLTAAMVERLGDLFPEAIRRGLLVVEADRYSFNHSNRS